jgi:hypothetical protein
MKLLLTEVIKIEDKMKPEASRASAGHAGPGA